VRVELDADGGGSVSVDELQDPLLSTGIMKTRFALLHYFIIFQLILFPITKGASYTCNFQRRSRWKHGYVYYNIVIIIFILIMMIITIVIPT
jgi:hypothetical protein